MTRASIPTEQIPNLFAEILDSLPDIVFVKESSELRYVYCNPALEALLKRPCAEILGRTDFDLFPAEQADAFQLNDRRVLDAGNICDVAEEAVASADGVDRIMHTKKAVLKDERSGSVYLLGTARDITARKKAETRAAQLNYELEAILQNLPDMIFVKDAKELRFVGVNRAAEQLLGFTQDEMIGKTDHDFFPQEEADFFVRKDREVLANKELLDIPEEKVQTRTKGERYLHTKKIPVTDISGEPLYLLGISRDITDQKELMEKIARLNGQLLEANQRLREMATHDDLTALKNVRVFREELEHELKRSRRSGYPLSLLLLDLDHFKQVNDQHGHLAGDYVLAEVATLLMDNIREIDLAARYGGEELAVLLPGINLDQAEQVADRLRQLIQDHPFRYEGCDLCVTASFGVATRDEQQRPTAQEMIRQVDEAMYRAKKNGRNRVECAVP